MAGLYEWRRRERPPGCARDSVHRPARWAPQFKVVFCRLPHVPLVLATTLGYSKELDGLATLRHRGGGGISSQADRERRDRRPDEVRLRRANGRARSGSPRTANTAS